MRPARRSWSPTSRGSRPGCDSSTSTARPRPPGARISTRPPWTLASARCRSAAHRPTTGYGCSTATCARCPSAWRRTVPRWTRPVARLPGAPGADRRPVRPRPVRARAGSPPLPHRRPRPVRPDGSWSSSAGSTSRSSCTVTASSWGRSSPRCAPPGRAAAVVVTCPSTNVSSATSCPVRASHCPQRTCARSYAGRCPSRWFRPRSWPSTRCPPRPTARSTGRRCRSHRSWRLPDRTTGVSTPMLVSVTSPPTSPARRPRSPSPRPGPRCSPASGSASTTTSSPSAATRCSPPASCHACAAGCRSRSASATCSRRRRSRSWPRCSASGCNSRWRRRSASPTPGRSPPR